MNFSVFSGIAGGLTKKTSGAILRKRGNLIDTVDRSCYFFARANMVARYRQAI